MPQRKDLQNFHKIGGNNILNNRNVLIYASIPNKQLPSC